MQQATAPHDQDDAYCAVVSDLVSLIEYVQKSLRLIEQTIAEETSPGNPESSTNVIVLDDVSPLHEGYSRVAALRRITACCYGTIATSKMYWLALERLCVGTGKSPAPERLV